MMTVIINIAKGTTDPRVENSISCNKSEVDQTSLIKMCFEMCTTLKETGSKFSFVLKLDSGFNFSLSSGGMPGRSPKAKTKRFA